MATIPLFTETTNTVFINLPCINACTNRNINQSLFLNRVWGQQFVSDHGLIWTRMFKNEGRSSSNNLWWKVTK